MAFLVGPIAAGLLLVGVLIYLMTSDRTRLRKTLELEEKRLEEKKLQNQQGSALVVTRHSNH